MIVGRRLAKRSAVVGATVVGTLGGVAWAAIPDSDGTITGCYANADTRTVAKGAVRVVDSSESCRSYETRITWSQRGPQGPAGVSGYELITSNGFKSSNTQTEEGVEVTVFCPRGKVPLGGGVDARWNRQVGTFGFANGVANVRASEPTPVNGLKFYLVNAELRYFEADSTIIYNAYLTCAWSS